MRVVLLDSIGGGWGCTRGFTLWMRVHSIYVDFYMFSVISLIMVY